MDELRRFLRKFQGFVLLKIWEDFRSGGADYDLRCSLEMVLMFLAYGVHAHQLLRLIYLQRVHVWLSEFMLLFLLLDHRSEGDGALLPVVASWDPPLAFVAIHSVQARAACAEAYRALLAAVVITHELVRKLSLFIDTEHLLCKRFANIITLRLLFLFFANSNRTAKNLTKSLIFSYFFLLGRLYRTFPKDHARWFELFTFTNNGCWPAILINIWKAVGAQMLDIGAHSINLRSTFLIQIFAVALTHITQFLLNMIINELVDIDLETLLLDWDPTPLLIFHFSDVFEQLNATSLQ